jgi:hypothetical protein
MECPICFETRTPYTFKSCTHSVCTSCARQMSTADKYQIQPFGCIPLPETFSCLECPICRAKEPNPITPNVKNQLIKKYPKQYIQWLEVNLNRHPCGMSFYTEIIEPPPKWCNNFSYPTKPPYHRSTFKKYTRIIQPR